MLACCAACRCGGGAGPDGGGLSRTVDVTRQRTFVTAAGREDVAFDLIDSDVKLLITDDAGQRVIYPEVTGAGTGTFWGVPPGPFIVSLNGYNLETNEDDLDLGLANLGRSGATASDGGAVVLQLDVTGLQPWQPFSDVLQLTSENAGYVALNAQAFVADQPDAGVTDASFPIGYFSACGTRRGRYVPLIDADAGDVMTLTQLQSAPVGDAGLLELRTLVRAAVLPAFSMADHALTQVPVALAAPATMERLSLDFRQSAFDALRSAVHPSAAAIASTVTVTALPFTADLGAYTAAPDLAVLRPQQLSQDVSSSFDTGNPFPASWPKLVSVRYTMQVAYDYPDGGTRALTTAMVTQDLLSAVGTAPLVPRVSPPRNIRVDGADGLQRAQISRLPVLSWDPPASGTPTSYGISLFRFTRIGSGQIINVSEGAFFEVTGTSFRLPFGEVIPGGEYVFGVTAIAAPGASVARAPFKGGFPIGAATALTTMLHVDPTLMP